MNVIPYTMKSTSQLHLENVNNIEGDQIAMEIKQHVEDTNTEDPNEEVKQVEDTETASKEQVEETKPQPGCFRIVRS